MPLEQLIDIDLKHSHCDCLQLIASIIKFSATRLSILHLFSLRGTYVGNL